MNTMPLKRIPTPRDWLKACRDPDHSPPSHMYLPNGLYEHSCPACGARARFWVSAPSLEVA